MYLKSLEVKDQNGSVAFTVKTDKLGQVCDIIPSNEHTKYLMNMYKGQPLVLCHEDLKFYLSSIIR